MGKRGPKPQKAHRLATVTEDYIRAFDMLEGWLKGEAREYKETYDKIQNMITWGDPDEVIHDFGASITQLPEEMRHDGDERRWVVSNSSQREGLIGRYKANGFIQDAIQDIGPDIHLEDLKPYFRDHRYNDPRETYRLSWSRVVTGFTELGYCIFETKDGEVLRIAGFDAGPRWRERRQELIQGARDQGLMFLPDLKFLIYQNMLEDFPDMSSQEFTYLWEEAAESENGIFTVALWYGH